MARFLTPNCTDETVFLGLVASAGYKDLLNTPGVGRIIAAQLIARFPNGMVSLAILMHVEQATGSYGNAGLVLAVTSIGQAISGPVISRWMGKWGMRPVLLISMVICALAISAIALSPASMPLYITFGFIAGISNPPIQSAVRTIYPKMVTAKQLNPLFALDASLQEIIWIIAPVLITFIVMQISTTIGLWVIVTILVLGGLWFIYSPEVGRVRIPQSRRALGKVLTRPAVLLATIMGFLLIGACAAVEAGVIATFGHSEDGGHGGGLEAGLVLAVFSVGSLIGGLFSGRLAISQWAMARRLLIVTAGLAVIPFFVNPSWAGQPYAIGAALTIAGLGVAPALAVIFAMTTASVKFSDTAEAFGWVATGQLIGAAAGSAVAGFLIDGIGPRGAYIAAAGFAGLGLIIAVLAVRGFPDLRFRDASPLPDTAPIRTVI